MRGAGGGGWGGERGPFGGGTVVRAGEVGVEREKGVQLALLWQGVVGLTVISASPMKP